MPFYEYQCSACGHHHEELQKVSDRPLRKCPACGRSTLRRLVSAPVFRLKGGGWYETDFKADKEAKRNLAGEREPPADKPAEPKAEPKADAKPDAKAADKAAAAPAAAKPKPAAAKPSLARRRPARRRR
jgi:putative FmdB family regulatory protein